LTKTKRGLYFSQCKKGLEKQIIFSIMLKDFKQTLRIKTKREKIEEQVNALFPRESLYIAYKNDFEDTLSTVNVQELNIKPFEYVNLRRFLIRWDRFLSDHEYSVHHLAYTDERNRGLRWFCEGYTIALHVYDHVLSFCAK